MAIKIFYFFIFYFFLAIGISTITGFTFNKNFENIAFLLAIILTLIFTFYLWKAIQNNNVKYELNSIGSYIGFIGVNFIVLFFIVGVLIYPTTYLIHKAIEKEHEENFKLISKDIPFRSFFSCSFEIKLENENSIIKKCLPSKKIYDDVIINSIVEAKTHKSFFGLTINSFSIQIKD